MRTHHWLLATLIPLAVTVTPARADTILTVSSAAFAANDAIPSEYTCDSDEKSPPLAWSGIPDTTRSIAILVDDPDAPKGTFTHWIVTNIPASERSISTGASVPHGATVAKNDKGTVGYAGPCPPPGSGTHRYQFHVYALDRVIARPASRKALLREMSGHILATGMLVGTYERPVVR